MKTLSTFHLTCFVILVLGALASAQDSNLAGHWTGTVRKGDRSGTMVLDLTASERKIGGALSDPSGQITKIENFKLDGRHFSFDTWVKEHGQPKEMHMVGEVEKDEIKLHREREGKSLPTIVFHRREQ